MSGVRIRNPPGLLSVPAVLFVTEVTREGYLHLLAASFLSCTYSTPTDISESSGKASWEKESVGECYVENQETAVPPTKAFPAQ